MFATTVVLTLTPLSRASVSSGSVIHFPGRHAMHNRKQANKYLTGTPRSFCRWAARYGHKIAPESICGSTGGVFIRKYDTQGFAAGYQGVSSAPNTLWARADGRWRLAAATQEAYFGCGSRHKLNGPERSGVHQCFTADSRVVRYHQS
ncbi:MAG TPA: hypothetical protein VHW64_02965 [Nocardioides sp.]|uniref:hypothetical protein n=1 Tax=Nocardioides sp. TaxID=35761 RepID=UPI002E316F67|nr:hypothetical protein [Nocardioides sp.]HEX3929638.1 hypothetical protein [Nocardioides sp.]